MSAITGTAVTSVALAKNTAAEITYKSATNTGTAVTDTETFDITPAKRDGELLILVKNASGATVKFTLLKGDFWASTADLTAVEVDTGKVFGITIDTAKYLQNDGKINLKVTPTAGTALTASDDVSVTAIEL